MHKIKKIPLEDDVLKVSEGTYRIMSWEDQVIIEKINEIIDCFNNKEEKK